MDRLGEMEAFVRVVDLGGFTEASRKMNLSKSAISKHVAALETRLGAQLLNRTTRRVSPTEIGLAYYDRAVRVLAEAQDADAMANYMQSTPRGELRISAPQSFGILNLAPAVAAFLRTFEDVSLHLTLDDRFVEIVSEGFDAAIRIGDLPDSSLMARKIGETRLRLAASPAYLEARGTPRTIDDLTDHSLLHYSNSSTGNAWRLRSAAGAERIVRVTGRLTINNGSALASAACAGIGIVAAPTFILSEAMERGDLVEVLPENSEAPIGIYAVYPPGRYVQPKLRAFLDFLADYDWGEGV